MKFDAISVLRKRNRFHPPIFCIQALPNVLFAFFEDPVEFFQGVLKSLPFRRLLIEFKIISHLFWDYFEPKIVNINQQTALPLIDSDLISEHHQSLQTPQNFSNLPKLLHCRRKTEEKYSFCYWVFFFFCQNKIKERQISHSYEKGYWRRMSTETQDSHRIGWWVKDKFPSEITGEKPPGTL